MTNQLKEFKEHLLELAEFVQDSAYEDYKSLCPDSIAQMLELSNRLSRVAGRLDDSPSDTDETPSTLPNSRQSRSIH